MYTKCYPFLIITWCFKVDLFIIFLTINLSIKVIMKIEHKVITLLLSSIVNWDQSITNICHIKFILIVTLSTLTSLLV